MPGGLRCRWRSGRGVGRAGQVVLSAGLLVASLSVMGLPRPEVRATPPGAAPLAPPLERMRVTSPFGWRTGPDGAREFHAGLDLSASRREAVRAAAPGVVERVAEIPGGYGRYLVIRHDGGLETLYAHTERVLVAEGARVRRGQRVALAGRTGNATATHLHFEVRLDGEAVDPAPYLGPADGR